MARRILSALLIFIGLAIILYPLGRGYYIDYQQNRLIAEWEKTSQVLVPEVPVIEATEPDNEAEELARKKEREAQEKERQEYIAKHIEGILSIDKINLKLPILTGTSDKNLLIAVGSLESTGKAGEVGNYAIAGHRNYGYGRHFNRLDELEAGDMIKVETSNAEFYYEVREKLYVLSEDVWVLESGRTESEITLITCHPVENPTHRLIIKGVLSGGQGLSDD